MTLGDLVGKVYDGDELIDDTTTLGGTPKPGNKLKTHTAFGFATQLVILDKEGKLEKVVAAHDVGRAINPALCSGQVEGSVHMGLGYALTEELPCDSLGMPVTFSMRDLGVLRAKDMPEIEVILVEDFEPEGPFGAKGVGGDRPRSDGPSGAGGAPRIRRRAQVHVADEGQPRRARDRRGEDQGSLKRTTSPARSRPRGGASARARSRLPPLRARRSQ